MMYLKSDPESTEKAAAFLSEGKILILPTDTVYGFSGIVDTTVSKTKYHTDDTIRRIKGRAETKPLIQLLGSPDDLHLYTDDTIPSQLLEKWPGALTIIVHNFEGSTTAFRCPGDEWIRNVIKKCGFPIYSTSVNRSGCNVLDSVAAIKTEFEREVSLIISDGDKKGSLPSTIVQVENGRIKVLRQGSVIL